MSRLLAACALLALSSSALGQQSAQLWDAPILVVPDNQQRMNALCDLNGDGWTDAVGAFYSKSDEVGAFGFVNDGAGRLIPTFAVHWRQFGNNDMELPIATADLTGDGLDDFIVCARTQFRVYRSNGAAEPTLQREILLGSGNEAQALVLADFDGDGALEAALRLRTSSGGERGIKIYDDLNGTPTQIAHIQPSIVNGTILKQADYDEDGRADLVSIGSRVMFFQLTTAGDLVELATFDHERGNEAMGEAGDIDGDGDEDVVVFGMDGQYTVLRKLGPGSYAIEADQVGGPATGLADVDGDGDLDGVCCGGGGGRTTYSNHQQSKFEISINDGTGGFAPAFRIPSYGANRIAGVDDIDQDGDADLIAGRVVYYNVHGLHPVHQAELGVNYPPADGLHDVDGDGDVDVQFGPLSFQRNRGDGVLVETKRRIPPAPDGHVYVGSGVQGDTDGDGDTDMLVRLETTTGTFVHERLLLNNGGGGFRDGGAALPDGVELRPEGSWGMNFVGDVNGDGLADLVLGQSSPYRTELWLQGPVDRFSFGLTLPGEVVKDLGDVDGDGFVDAVTLSANDWGVRWGAATSPLGTGTPLSIGTGTYWEEAWVPLADADGDGDLDLFGPGHVVGDEFMKKLRVLENLGGRSFNAHEDLLGDLRGALVPLVVADVNADGWLDVLVGQRENQLSPQTVYGNTVFLGSSTPYDFTCAGAETYPIFWNFADLDGDGDLDGLDGTTTYEAISRDETTSGSCLQYGRPTRGLGGEAPTLGMVGPFITGNDVELRLTGAAPGVPGILLMGDGEHTLGVLEYQAAFPIFPLRWQHSFPTTGGNAGESGSGHYELTIHVPLAMAGRSIHHQAVVFDANGPGGVTVSNVVRASYVSD